MKIMKGGKRTLRSFVCDKTLEESKDEKTSGKVVVM